MRIFFWVMTFVWLVLGTVVFGIELVTGVDTSDVSRHAYVMMSIHLGFACVLDKLSAREG